MGGLSIWHWIIVLIIVMLVFGTKKLRNIGEDLGGAVRGFKEGMKSAEEKDREVKAAEAAPPPAGHRWAGYRGRGQGKDEVLTDVLRA